MRFLVVAFFAIAAASATAQPAARNPFASEARLYVGGGIAPGLGVVAIGSDPALDLFTREVALYADYQPRVVGGAGRLLTAVGVGGSLRVLRLVDIIQNRDPGRFELDAGFRFGPSFYTAFFTQTAESEAKAFAIFVDPFARGTVRLGGSRTAFAEIGLQAPALRGGLVLTIGG